MVELQLLNKILHTRSFSIVVQHGLGPQHFITYFAEFQFIADHYQKYGTVPDRETFIATFPDFDLFDVNEADLYLVETIRENFLYHQMVPFVNQVGQLVSEDSEKAIQFVKDQMQMFNTLAQKPNLGYDIIANSVDREADFMKRLSNEGLLGIPTGIEELDNITHGWLPGEDFVVIVGRTNEGKSWVLLFFLVMAWIEGKTVLLYSGEMSKLTVGFRFDTLYKHFLHGALMGGLPDLGDGRNVDDYFKYLKNLRTTEGKPPFIVVTPRDIGGQRLDIPKLEQLIEQYEPDIIGIDQLSLMEDYRASRGQQERMKFTHISEDLYLTSEKYKKPILAPAQASRDNDGSEETPELGEIAESDGVGQNATRVIGMKQLGNTLKITVRKNRYGKKNEEILLLWDIDKGVIKPFLHVQKDAQENVTNTTPISTGVEGTELF